MDLKLARTGEVARRFAQQATELLQGPPSHPYHPADLELPGFQPLTLPFQQILACFFGPGLALLGAVWLLAGRCRHLDAWGRGLLCWLVFSGTVHLVVEGTYVLRPDYYRNTGPNVLLEMWKEYTKADSRYVTRDGFVVAMESITAFFVGPACYLAALAMAWRSPWRHPLQLVASLSQLYGDVCYFLTAHLEGYRSSRPEFLYFWFYFVIVNAVWIVVPACVVLAASRAIARATQETDRYSKVEGLNHLPSRQKVS